MENCWSGALIVAKRDEERAAFLLGCFSPARFNFLRFGSILCSVPYGSFDLARLRASSRPSIGILLCTCEIDVTADLAPQARGISATQNEHYTGRTNNAGHLRCSPRNATEHSSH
jgi:hypothetical protein